MPVVRGGNLVVSPAVGDHQDHILEILGPGWRYGQSERCCSCADDQDSHPHLQEMALRSWDCIPLERDDSVKRMPFPLEDRVVALPTSIHPLDCAGLARRQHGICAGHPPSAALLLAGHVRHVLTTEPLAGRDSCALMRLRHDGPHSGRAKHHDINTHDQLRDAVSPPEIGGLTYESEPHAAVSMSPPG